MIRLAALCALLVSATCASAQSVKLSAAEIITLLSGNTAIGKWEGARYRQFFDVDGVTYYAQENTRSSRGEWRVDESTDEYQSIWARDADFEGWYVMEHAGAYFWVSKSTPPTPFRVELGQQLNFDE